MTYDAQASSDRDSLPVYLYTFVRGSRRWRYTNVDTDQVVDGATYLSDLSISHGDIEVGQELSKLAIKVTVPRTHPIAEMVRISPPREEIGFILQSIEYFDGERELVAGWSGRLAAPNWTKAGTCELSIEPAQTSMRRLGLRQTQQKMCPYVLFGPGCNANRGAHRVDAVLQATTGITISAPEFALKPDGRYAGGFIEWSPEVGTVDRRFIIDHVGDTITLDSFALDLAAGRVVAAFPGCDHTTFICEDEFDNILNYGGIPAFADLNPFNGTTLY